MGREGGKHYNNPYDGYVSTPLWGVVWYSIDLEEGKVYFYRKDDTLIGEMWISDLNSADPEIYLTNGEKFYLTEDETEEILKNIERKLVYGTGWMEYKDEVEWSKAVGDKARDFFETSDIKVNVNFDKEDYKYKVFVEIPQILQRRKNYITPEDILEIAKHLQEIGAITGSNILIQEISPDRISFTAVPFKELRDLWKESKKKGRQNRRRN